MIVHQIHSLIPSDEYQKTEQQALTTPRKIRLPIGQLVAKNQVAPIIIFRLPPFAYPYGKQLSI